MAEITAHSGETWGMTERAGTAGLHSHDYQISAMSELHRSDNYEGR